MHIIKLYLYYLNNFSRNCNFNYYGVMVTQLNKFISLYSWIRLSPWRWPECRSKQVGENFVNKTHQKHWSAFVSFKILRQFFIFFSWGKINTNSRALLEKLPVAQLVIYVIVPFPLSYKLTAGASHRNTYDHRTLHCFNVISYITHPFFPTVFQFFRITLYIHKWELNTCRWPA